MQNLKEIAELAEILKKSNVKEVAALAEGFLALDVLHSELLHRYTMQTAEIVLNRHHRLLQRLGDE